MRSRELPSFRTLAHAWPDAAVEVGSEHVVLAIPGRSWWVLDEPPADLGPWLARAPREAELWWEGRLGTTDAPLPPGVVATELRCWMHDLALDPQLPEGVRPLAADELEPAVALLVAGGTPEALARWQLSGHLRQRDEGAGVVLATGAPGAIDGVVSCTWNGREARLQGLAVAPDRRRMGLGRRLLTAALTEWQGIAFGTAYAVAAPGTPIEALLRAAELRPVTSVVRIVRG